MTDTPPTAEAIMTASASAAAEIRLPLPPFSFAIRWTDDYDQLFRGDFQDETGPNELVERSSRTGRVLLQAAAGAGKTSILRRIFKTTQQDRTLVVFIELKGWNPSLSDEWQRLEDNEPERMRLLLTNLATPTQTTEEVMNRLGPDYRRIVLVDGVNEIPRPFGDSVIRTLGAFARRNPLAGVIATDRLVRRVLEDSAWALATIAPLNNDPGLAGNAFFRNLVEQQGIDSSSSADIHHLYLVHHAQLSDQDIGALSRAAFQLYQSDRSRLFTIADLRLLSEDRVVDSLIEDGVIAKDGDVGSFSHHLIHDYLASVALAEDRSLWNSDGFDTVTLDASSFDALSMTLEQLELPALADLFIRSVYDWNFYGSAYALATCRARESAAVTGDMEVVLLAMLAERRWDPIGSTAQQVTDALSVFPSDVATQMLQAPDLADVIAIASSSIANSNEFGSWLELFSTRPGKTMGDDQLRKIEDADSLIGWTMANVLKRTQLQPNQSGLLRELLAQSDNPIVRWRIVHALGADPDRQTVDSLLASLQDPYQWVQTGAIRSLVEVASHSHELRSIVFENIRSLVEEGDLSPQVVGQLERSLVLREPPPEWVEVVGPTVEDLWASAETQIEQDRWRRVGYDIRKAQDREFSDVAPA